MDRLLKIDDLLSLRPRMLRSQAALVLDMPIGDIPDGAFRAWLGRYRKGNKTLPKEKKNKVTAMASGEIEIEKEEPDWRDFKPTELVIPSYHDDGPIFKRIDYSQVD